MDDNIKKSYDRITERYHNALRALVDSEKSDQAMNHDHNETLLLMMQKYLDEGWGSTMEQLMIKPLIVAIRDKIELEVDNKFLQQQVRTLKEDLKEAMPVIKALNNKIRALEGKTDNIFSMESVNKVLKDDANNWFNEMNEIDERIKEFKRVEETEPCCTSCGVPYVKHMGIIGVCADNAALREDLKDSLEAHDEMRQEITTQRIEIERLSAAVVKLSQSSLPENVEISILRKERDAARRLACEYYTMEGSSSAGSEAYCKHYSTIEAKTRGWDCFKEKEAQQAMNNIAKLDEDLGL